jgi:hypothetical protein
MAKPGYAVGIAPFNKVQNITKSDSTVYDPPLDAIFVGGAGNVALVDLAGNTVTITGVIAGQILPIGASKIMSTNTTATNICGLNW